MKNLAQSSIYRTRLKTSVPSIFFSSPIWKPGQERKNFSWSTNPKPLSGAFYLASRQPCSWPRHWPGKRIRHWGQIALTPCCYRTPLQIEHSLANPLHQPLPSGSDAQTFVFAGPLASWTVFVVNFIAPSRLASSIMHGVLSTWGSGQPSTHWAISPDPFPSLQPFPFPNIAQAGLNLTSRLRMSQTSRFSCLRLRSVGITGVSLWFATSSTLHWSWIIHYVRTIRLDHGKKLIDIIWAKLSKFLS